MLGIVQDYLEPITTTINVDDFCDSYEIQDITDISSYEMEELLIDYLAEHSINVKFQNWEFSMDESQIIIYMMGD